jgi:hypothetical protein
VIVTGVPRAGRDDEYSAALARGNHKASAHVVERPVETSSPTAPKSPPPLSAQVASESEPRRVWATVEPPSEKTCGTILEGTWTIAGNVIRVLDMDGPVIYRYARPQR